MTTSQAVTEVMGGVRILKVTVRSAADLERLVARGLPVGVLEHTLTYMARCSVNSCRRVPPVCDSDVSFPRA